MLQAWTQAYHYSPEADFVCSPHSTLLNISRFACMYVHTPRVWLVPTESRRENWILDPPELELQAAVSHMWVLGADLSPLEGHQELLTFSPALLP